MLWILIMIWEFEAVWDILASEFICMNLPEWIFTTVCTYELHFIRNQMDDSEEWKVKAFSTIYDLIISFSLQFTSFIHRVFIQSL